MGFVCIPCSVLCFGARSPLFILQRLFALKHSYVSSWRAWWIATRENRKFCWRLRHLFVLVCEMYLNLGMSPYLRTTHVLPVTVRLSRYGWVCVLPKELLGPLIALLACCCSLPVCNTRLGLCYSEPGTVFSMYFLCYQFHVGWHWAHQLLLTCAGRPKEPSRQVPHS